MTVTSDQKISASITTNRWSAEFWKSQWWLARRRVSVCPVSGVWLAWFPHKSSWRFAFISHQSISISATDWTLTRPTDHQLTVPMWLHGWLQANQRQPMLWLGAAAKRETDWQLKPGRILQGRSCHLHHITHCSAPVRPTCPIRQTRSHAYCRCHRDDLIITTS